MKVKDLRSQFIDFFASQTDRPHTPLPGSPLVMDDPSIMFTNAGMNQFKRVFMGEEQQTDAAGQVIERAVTCQPCMRAGGKHNDIEEVGYTTRHHTFFEMMGNFSFGDYGADVTIELGWEFLTKTLGLPADKLWVTVFEDDDETAQLWRKITGIPESRMSRLGAKDNFWAMGDTGPCGPCTEIFYDHGPDVPGGPPGSPNEDDGRYIEIWNHVLMRYNRQPDGELQPLPKPSIDTGMGLERIAAVLQGVHDNYDIDLFVNLRRFVSETLGITGISPVATKVITDHMRASTFLMAEDTFPSNEGRGYVVRRLLRRAMRYAFMAGVREPIIHKMVQAVVDEMGEAYPHIVDTVINSTECVKQEETQFLQVIEQGSQRLQQALGNVSGKQLDGQTAFQLYDTYGFPIDLTRDMAREQGMDVDMAGFEAAMAQQRETSKASSAFADMVTTDVNSALCSEFVGYDEATTNSVIKELWQDGKMVDALNDDQSAGIVLEKTPFYPEGGGQIGDSGVIRSSDGVFEVTSTQRLKEAIVHFGQLQSGQLSVNAEVAAEVSPARADVMRHHSATHLLQSALQRVLGDHVRQKGSLVTADRLRFDFSHNQAITADELVAIEQQVNEVVMQNLACTAETMPIDEAKARGAMALFGEKYGNEVRVMAMGDYSIELCGGTHVSRTGDIGCFKIVSESSVAQGIRRIEAVAGSVALQWFDLQLGYLKDTCSQLKTTPVELSDRATQLLTQLKKLKKQPGSSAVDWRQVAASCADQQQDVAGHAVILAKVPFSQAADLRQVSDQLRHEKRDVFVLVGEPGSEGESFPLLAYVDKALHGTFTAKDVMNQLASELGGRGGGRPDMAQGAANQSEKIDRSLESCQKFIIDQLNTR